ncbi:DUF3284 domain-containing protein [Pediococcus siamensis]|uniref:DUF3284 domain-containing protein n=1 Tax=Pediococcus siamensis TaxID=381829 RepID=UPI00399FD107
MKLIRTIDVSSEEFYDYLESQLLKDIKVSTGHLLTPKNIKGGLIYKKRPKKTQGVLTIKIDDYQRGYKYQVTSKSPLEQVTVIYTTESISERQTKVTLIENISSYNPNKHHLFIRWFSEASFLGRMSDTVFGIEKGILDQRE